MKTKNKFVTEIIRNLNIIDFSKELDQPVVHEFNILFDSLDEKSQIDIATAVPHIIDYIQNPSIKLINLAKMAKVLNK